MQSLTESKMEQLQFLTSAQVADWLAQPDSEWMSHLVLGSVSLLEHLTNDVAATNDAAFAANYGLCERFLARLDTAVSSGGTSVENLANILGILTTYFVEAGPYRFETKPSPKDQATAELLKAYRTIRERVVAVTTALFELPIFDPIRDAVEREIKPLLESGLEEFDGRDDRYMPFRVLLVNALSEAIRILQLRVDKRKAPELAQLLDDMYQLKYIRFGTSGFRGVWNRDFTEEKVRIVTQAICDYMNSANVPTYAVGTTEDLNGRVVVIGYDGRRSSPFVARIVAEVCLANGFKVHYASRPSPTPALNFYAREVIGRDRVAALINCTASHNPPEWQGIKFNPRQGYPAPTKLTDVIASRASFRQLMNTPIPRQDTVAAEAAGTFQQFDPRNLYLDYVRNSGKPGANNRRLSINLDNIKQYFSGKKIILDPMYGSGEGYLTKILGELGIPHTSIHDERDEDLGKQTETVRGIPHLEYANPEPDFIQPLVDEVVAQGADLGLGLDTDADRFGVVDRGGKYIRPNQILAMLTRYLGIERGEEGRVIITQTGLPMIDALAGKMAGNAAYRPPAGTIPAYISHPFYYRRLGSEKSIAFANTWVVPVGIKYIIDVARVPVGVTDPRKAYDTLSDAQMPADWMDTILIGGEESSGLTTRGHVPDKDGIWADLLILDMLAYYGLKSPSGETSLSDIWRETTEMEGAWKTNGNRIDLDTTTEAKEGLLNHYLDIFKDWPEDGALPTIAGLEVYYLGGTRYDFVEIFLQDEKYGKRHFLRVRSSGTEPITRVYVESADEAIAQRMLDAVLAQLDALNVKIIGEAYSIDRLADVLSNTHPSPAAHKAAADVIAARGWQKSAVIEALKLRIPHVESRNVKVVQEWLHLLEQ